MCLCLGTHGLGRACLAQNCTSQAHSWAEAHIKIARMTLTIKLDGNWNSFQLANNTPPLGVTGSVIAPSARMDSLFPRRGTPTTVLHTLPSAPIPSKSCSHVTRQSAARRRARASALQPRIVHALADFLFAGRTAMHKGRIAVPSKVLRSMWRQGVARALRSVLGPQGREAHGSTPSRLCAPRAARHARPTAPDRSGR